MEIQEDFKLSEGSEWTDEGFRFERKYQIPGPYSKNILPVLKSHRAGFRALFQPRQVNSLYFDTIDLSDFFDNFDGISNRSKFRLRWYGDLNQTVQQSSFEIKLRRAQLIRKLKIDVGPFDLTDHERPKKILDHLSHTALPVLLRTRLIGLHPVAVVSYQRSYWLSHDKKVRITVDHGLEYRSYMRGWKPGFVGADSDSIVEIKYGMEAYPDISTITQQLPFRLSRNSKYGQAIRWMKS